MPAKSSRTDDMFLFDATHTSHTQAQTGIQRVCRSLFVNLRSEELVTGVCYDPYLRSWRILNETELASLRPGQKSSGSRRAKWPLRQRTTSYARRLTGRIDPLPESRGLIVPELFSPQTASHLQTIFSAAEGPRVAIFYDAIPLKFPELTPAGTVSRMPGYLRELLQFDGIAAISEDSAQSLRNYWEWLGVRDYPPVQAIPLGVDPLNVIASRPGISSASAVTARVLSVGTIEGRKNHLALLDATEILWSEGLVFELELLGLARPDTATKALQKIDGLKRSGRPLIYRGSVPDDELKTAYRDCAFTVYPSLMEGFGLPVIESLQHGRPCICSGHGALAESARGGGCITLESMDATRLADAMRRLLKNPVELNTLVKAAKNRRFKSWSDYAHELTAWMATLPRRS